MSNKEKINLNGTARISENYNKRRVLAQVLASGVTDFQYFSLGAALGFATVEVAGLSKTGLERDAIETTETELSWIGSICFISQASGNLLGGPTTAWVGRKRAMVLGNVPYVLAWILMWQAADFPTLLIGNAFLGLGTGLLSAPMTSYIGEICQPSLRGLLAGSAEVFVSVGTCGVFILGTLLPWRTACIIYLCVAIFSTIILFFVPETPIWLLSKGRNDEALKSLQWLRGWVEPQYVQKEYDDLYAYNQNNYRCRRCDKLDGAASCPHVNETTWQRFKTRVMDIKRREAWRPLILSSMFFTFSSMTGLIAIKPTMINLLAAFKVPVDPTWNMAVVGSITILGAIICMSLVKLTGKRPIAIGCMLGSCVTTFALAVYAQVYIAPSVSSFEEVKFVEGENSWIPLVLFMGMVFFNHVGIVPITWMIISEIFPYTIRGFACGFVGAMCDISAFIAAKSYLDVENSMHIYGGLYFYAAISLLGAFYLHLFLIETEGRSQPEIEAIFADKDRVFYADDWFSRKLIAFCCKSSSGEAEPSLDPGEMVALNKQSAVEEGIQIPTNGKDTEVT